MEIMINNRPRSLNHRTRAGRTITRQPGYRGPRHNYTLARAITGGIRLYAAIGDQWMDASLADISAAALPGIRVR